MKSYPIIICVIATLLAVAMAGSKSDKHSPAKPKSGSNLDLWLGQSESQPTSQSATAPAEGVNPFGAKNSFRRADALPGVIELSDGRILAGGIYTTVEKPLIAFVEKEKRWRRIPLISVLGIRAVIVEEKMDLRWRWKAMGVPERVYTGKKYPTRRLKWEFHLIDGTKITGAIKGQPIWIECGKKTIGPFVLHERSKGKDGQSLKDLLYVKRIIISRRMMKTTNDEQQATGNRQQATGTANDNEH